MSIPRYGLALGLLLSLLLHLSGLLYGIRERDGKSQGGEGAPPPVKLRVSLKPTEAKPQPISEGTVPMPAERKKEKRDCAEADEGYWGIGIWRSLIRPDSGRCTVSEVVPGGPADRAGIEAGDEYLVAGGCEAKGDGPTELRLELWKLGSTSPRSLSIRRERICLENTTDSPP